MRRLKAVAVPSGFTQMAFGSRANNTEEKTDTKPADGRNRSRQGFPFQFKYRRSAVKKKFLYAFPICGAFAAAAFDKLRGGKFSGAPVRTSQNAVEQKRFAASVIERDLEFRTAFAENFQHPHSGFESFETSPIGDEASWMKSS